MSQVNVSELCPFLTSQKLLSGKWSIYILHLLINGPVRFNELLRLMPKEVTHTTLSRQLKFLEEEGIVSRTDYKQNPPKVEYALTEIGKKFQPVLSQLEIWANAYLSQNKKPC